MKTIYKIICFMSTLFITSIFCSCMTAQNKIIWPSTVMANNFKTDMPCEEIYMTLNEHNTLHVDDENHIYFRDKKGTNVVLTKSSDKESISKINTFELIPLDSDFNQIKPRMSVEEVINKIGVPFQSVTSGFYTTDFYSQSGSIYRIQWTTDMLNGTTTVLEGKFISDSNNAYATQQ